MNVRSLARIGAHVMAAVASVRALRQARADGDTLRLLDAITNALAVATTTAILIRELRERAAEPDVADEVSR